MRTVDVGGVRVGILDLQGWIEALSPRMAMGRPPHHHVSLNAAKWEAARHDPELRRAVFDAGSVAADGIGIVWAARWIGHPLPARVPGADLAAGLVDRAIVTGARIGLLGGRPEVVDTVARQLRDRGGVVAHAAHGYFDPADAPEIVAHIEAASVQILLIALGSPRTEHFVGRHGPRIPLILGVGGTFDVWAGVARRAPATVQDLGLEWAWRFAGDPRRRFRRAIVDSAAFALAIARGERVPWP